MRVHVLISGRVQGVNFAIIPVNKLKFWGLMVGLKILMMEGLKLFLKGILKRLKRWLNGVKKALLVRWLMRF